MKKRLMKKIANYFVGVLATASCAFGQIDTFGLRTKYGIPLDRETFIVRPGIEMVVDYGPSKQVCQIRLPSGVQITGAAPAGVVTKQQIDEIVNEVVPPSIRGKETNHVMLATGTPTIDFTEYEHVTVNELQVSGVGKGITITFKDPACPKKTAR